MRILLLASAFMFGVARPGTLLGQGRAEQVLAHAPIWGPNNGFDGYAFLPVTIHGKAATVVIDLNCTRCDLELSDAALATLGTSSTGTTDSLTIGGVTEKNIPVQHNAKPTWSVPKPDFMPIVVGIVGVHFMQRFDVVYDFPHRRVQLYRIAKQPADVRNAWLPSGFTANDCGAMVDVPPGAGTFTGVQMQIDGKPVTGVIEMGPYVPKMNERAFTTLGLPDSSARVTITGRTPIYGNHVLLARVTGVRMTVGTHTFGTWDSEVLQDVDVQALLPPNTPVMLMNLSMLREVVLFNGMSSRQVCIAPAATAGPALGRPAANSATNAVGAMDNGMASTDDLNL